MTLEGQHRLKWIGHYHKEGTIHPLGHTVVLWSLRCGEFAFDPFPG